MKKFFLALVAIFAFSGIAHAHTYAKICHKENGKQVCKVVKAKKHAHKKHAHKKAVAAGRKKGSSGNS